MSGELSPNGRVDAHVVATTTGRRGDPCHWCRAGDHHMCTGVGCYRCDYAHGKHGVRQPVAGPLRGGMPEDDQ